MTGAMAGAGRRPANKLGRLLLILGVAIGALSQPRHAQSDGSIIAQAGTHDFTIAAQPLAEAIIQFGRQSGLQVVVQADAAQGLRTRGVSGRMTSEQALAALLSGTGLVHRVTGSLVVVEKPGATGSGAVPLDPVQVQGALVPPQAMIDNLPPPYAGGQVATGGQLGLLGNRDVMDTPFNQTSYTAKKAQDQQAQTVKDVLLDDPSVQSTSSSGSISGDNTRIRGFDVYSGTVSYGGLFSLLPSYSIPMELAERVEVLKGPSAMLNGMPPMGAIGGTINVVPKRAPDAGLTQFTASYNSVGQVGGAVDVGRRFGDDKQFGVRFNGVFRAGQTAIDYNTDQRALAALGLDFRGEHVRLSIDAGYQYQYLGGVVPMAFLASGIPLSWAPNASGNFGQPWNYQEMKDLFGVIRAEIDLTERVTAYASFGAHDFRRNGFWGSSLFITDATGAATSTPQLSGEYGTYVTGEAGLRGFVDTGPIGHELALNAMALEQSNGEATVYGTDFTTNIYTPTYVARPSLATPAVTKTSSAGQYSVGIADTLSAADKRIQLTAGARWQQVKATYFDPVTGVAMYNYDETAVSPSVSLVFKPWQNVMLYGNWIQGLQQGQIVGASFANAGEIFPPFKSTQYEVGLKADWGKFTTTVSAFQISQPSLVVDAAANTLVLNGEQRNRGLEINFFGEPIDRVRLLGGVTFLDAVLTRTQGGLNDGWEAPGVPNVQLRLAGEWDTPFVRGLTLDGRVIYTGVQYYDTEYPRRMIPDWTRFDVGARYTFENPGAKGKPLVARFNVENLFDTSYWLAQYGFLGAPRTFRLSLTADF